jgi:outer membrane autotransporter protein
MRAAANLSEPYHMALSEHLNDIRHSGGVDGQVVMLRPKGSSNSIAPLSAAGSSGADDKRMEFWGRAFGRWASTRGDVEATGYDEDTYGAVLGADFQVSQNVIVGLVTGYMDDKLKFDDGDLGKIKRWSIGGYLSATINQFYIDGSLTYASDNYRVHRMIQYGDLSCLAFTCTTSASSKYDGNGVLGHAEVGYLFDLGNGAALRPFAGLNYSSVDADPFSETGGGDLGLDVIDGTGKSFQSRLGARLSGVWGDGSTKWIPELRAEWRHEFKDNPSWIVASLNGLPNDPFTAIGSKVTQDLAVVGAGVTALMSNGVGVFFDYQGAFGSGYHSHAIQGGVRVKF